ncbi:MAG: molybdopterin converting factor subunit 1 [Saprospiraceae bacterium]
MKIDILAFGIAKDILETQQLSYEIEDRSSIAALKEQLCQAYPAFEKLRCLSIAVNAEYQEDDFILNEKDEIAIIPPVSGG